MINISTQEIYVYSSHVNMRNSFDSLCFLVDSMFPEKLLTGSVFVFLKKAVFMSVQMANQNLREENSKCFLKG